MRIKWDQYFYNICEEVSKNSKCLSRHIGSILVRDNSIISTGYNGPPRKVPHCNERYNLDPELRKMFTYRGISPTKEQLSNICPRYIAGFKSGEGLEYCIAGHSERNSLINAARYGIATKGAKMYMNCQIPCTPCLVEIIGSGIEEIIVTGYKVYDVSSKYLLNNSNLKYRIFDHLKEK